MSFICTLIGLTYRSVDCFFVGLVCGLFASPLVSIVMPYFEVVVLHFMCLRLMSLSMSLSLSLLDCFG